MKNHQTLVTGQMVDRQGWRLGSGLPMSPGLTKGTVCTSGHHGNSRMIPTDGTLTHVIRCIQLSVRGCHVLKVRFGVGSL